MGVTDPNQRTAYGRSTVASIIIHENYRSKREVYQDDIALLSLCCPMPLGYHVGIGTACLPQAGSSANFVGTK